MTGSPQSLSNVFIRVPSSEMEVVSAPQEDVCMPSYDHIKMPERDPLTEFEAPPAKKIALIGEGSLKGRVDVTCAGQIPIQNEDLVHSERVSGTHTGPCMNECFTHDWHIPPHISPFLDASFQASKAEVGIFITETIQRIKQVLYVLSSLGDEVLFARVRGSLTQLKGFQRIAFSSNYLEINNAIISIQEEIAEALQTLDLRVLEIMKNYFVLEYICPFSSKKTCIALQEFGSTVRLAIAKKKLTSLEACNLGESANEMIALGRIEDAIALEEKMSLDHPDREWAIVSIVEVLAKECQFDRAQAFAAQISGVMKEAVLASVAEGLAQAKLFNQALDVAVRGCSGPHGEPILLSQAVVSIIRELVKVGRFDHAISIVREMNVSLLDKELAFVAIAAGLVRAGRWQHALLFSQQISAPDSVVDSVRFQTIGLVVKELMSGNQFEEALYVLEERYLMRSNSTTDIKDELNLFKEIVNCFINANNIWKIFEFVKRIVSGKSDFYVHLQPFQKEIFLWIGERLAEAGFIDEATVVVDGIQGSSPAEKEKAYIAIIKKLGESGRLREAIGTAEKSATIAAYSWVIIEMVKNDLFEEAYALMKAKIPALDDKLWLRGWIAIELARRGHYERAINEARAVLDMMTSFRSTFFEQCSLEVPEWWNLPVIERHVFSEYDLTIPPRSVDLLGQIVGEMIKAGQLHNAAITLKDITEEECKGKNDLLSTLAVENIKMGRLLEGYSLVKEISDQAKRNETYMKITVELTKANNFDEARAVMESGYLQLS